MGIKCRKGNLLFVLSRYYTSPIPTQLVFKLDSYKILDLFEINIHTYIHTDAMIKYNNIDFGVSLFFV